MSSLLMFPIALQANKCVWTDWPELAGSHLFIRPPLQHHLPLLSCLSKALMLGFTFLLSGHPSFAFAGSHLQAGEPQGYGFMNLYPVRLLGRSLCPSFLFPFYGGGFGSGKSCIFLVFLDDIHTHTHHRHIHHRHTRLYILFCVWRHLPRGKWGNTKSFSIFRKMFILYHFYLDLSPLWLNWKKKVKCSLY